MNCRTTWFLVYGLFLATFGCLDQVDHKAVDTGSAGSKAMVPSGSRSTTADTDTGNTISSENRFVVPGICSIATPNGCKWEESKFHAANYSKSYNCQILGATTQIFASLFVREVAANSEKLREDEVKGYVSNGGTMLGKFGAGKILGVQQPDSLADKVRIGFDVENQAGEVWSYGTSIIFGRTKTLITQVISRTPADAKDRLDFFVSSFVSLEK